MLQTKIGNSASDTLRLVGLMLVPTVIPLTILRKQEEFSVHQHRSPAAMMLPRTGYKIFEPGLTMRTRATMIS